MNTNTLTFVALAVAIAVVLTLAVAPAFITSASAKISCKNPGGQEPQGNCQGRALERVNPAGHAPPGQNN